MRGESSSTSRRTRASPQIAAHLEALPAFDAARPERQPDAE